MARCLVVFAVGVVLAGTARAQDAVEESVAYHAWYAANEAKDVPKALTLAKEYLAKHPQGQQAEFLTSWVAGARGALFNEAIQKKDMAALVGLGKERLAEDPNDLAYLLSLSMQLRRHELFASPPVFTHGAEAADFGQRAIALIEAGKTPPGVDPAKWSKNDTVSWLYQNVAAVRYKDGQKDEALAAFTKASALDPDNATLVAYNDLYCGLIHKDRYDDAARRFQALPEAERTAAEASPAVKAALEEVNQHADDAIKSWARFVALAEAKGILAATREQIAKTLGDLWTYRNPEDPDGLKKLIDSLRPGGAPAAPAAP
jgi:tetratricopeptide (TPR) repeat protein